MSADNSSPSETTLTPMQDMGYISDRLSGIMEVSRICSQIKEMEMTPEERNLLASAKTLEERDQLFPELSRRATEIFNRAVAIANGEPDPKATK